MALSTSRWILILVLVVFGLYMAIWHAPPLPANHEDWLGKNHIAHTVIGIVLLVAAGYVWWSSRGKAPAPAT